MTDRALPQLIARVRYDDSELQAAQKGSALTGQQLQQAITQHNAVLVQHGTLVDKAAASNLRYAESLKAAKAASPGYVAQRTSQSQADYLNFTDMPGATRFPPQHHMSAAADVYDIQSQFGTFAKRPDLINSTDPGRFASEGWKQQVKAMQEFDAAGAKIDTRMARLREQHDDNAKAGERHGRSIHNLGGFFGGLEHGAGRAAHGVELLGAQVGRLGARAAGASGAASFLSPLTSLGPVGGALIGGAAVAGAGLALNALVHSEGQLATSILATANASKLGVREAQSYLDLLQKEGFTAQQAAGFFSHLRAQIDSNNPSVRAMGITTKDTNEAVLQAADYVNKHGDALRNAKLAEDVFGTGGAALLPIFRQGREFLQGYTDEMDRYGALLDKDQLKTAAWQEGARAQFDLAAQGILNQFIAPMEIGFGQFELSASKMFKDSGEAAKQFGQIVANVASFASGVLSFITGKQVNLATTNEIDARYHAAAAGHAAAMDQARSSASGLAATEATLQKNTQLATQAIQDRIDTERDLLAATEKRLDAQQKEIEADDQELAKAASLVDTKRQLADTEKRLAKDQHDLARAQVTGNLKEVQRANEQLTADKEKQADDQKKAVIQGQRDELHTRLDAISKERKAAQEQAQERTKQLEADRKDVERTAAANAEAARASQESQAAGYKAQMAQQVQGNADWIKDFTGMTGTMSIEWARAGSDMMSDFHDFLWGGGLSSHLSKGGGGGIGIIPMIQDGAVIDAVTQGGNAIGKGFMDGMKKGAAAAAADENLPWPLKILKGAGDTYFAALGGGLDFATGQFRLDTNTGLLVKRAAGGRYPAGMPRMTGELGTEIDFPDRPGYVMNHGDAVAALRGGHAQQGRSLVIKQLIISMPNLVAGDHASLRQAVSEGIAEAGRR